MLLAAGRLEEAARTWPAPQACRCRDPVDYAANFPPLALYRARAMAGLGRSDEAVRELDGVLAFWKEADPDLPVLVAVKELRARLAMAAPTRKAGPHAAPRRRRSPSSPSPISRPARSRRTSRTASPRRS
jgi:hypothetical protein